MQLLKKIPFFLFLLVVFFCLHGSVENYGYLNPVEVLKVGAIIILCMAIPFLAIGFFTKNYLFSSLVCFFIALWYLFFGAIHDWIKATSFLSFLKSYTILIPLLLVVTILWIWWVKKNKSRQQALVMYLNILFLVICISDTVLLINKHNRFSNTKVVKSVAFNLAKPTQKPNVYFLLFDEYAGYKSLQDSFGFSNDSLYNFLQQKDFKVLPVFSNYDYTPFSMSSILNMRYVDPNYNHTLLTQADIQARFGEIRNAGVFSIFRSMNYTIENYSVFDIKDHPALSGSNPLFPIHSYLLTDKIFHNRLIKDLGWWFVTGKFQIPFIKDQYLLKDDAYNKKAEQKVLQSASTKTGSPKFCYAHFFLPHGKYFRDSSGALNSIVQMQDLFNKPLYLSYLKYTNGVIRNLVNTIVNKDSGAIVIVMSDHGFYNYQSLGDDDPLNYDNFCLVRFPGKNYLPYKDKWSNVNFFRYVFNCQFGQSLPYLKDSTIFVNE